MDNFETIIAEMRRYAEANNVPIIEDDSIKFINKYIELNNVKSILEIGTAIGYSAMLMTSASPDVEITTIERDDKKYREAVKNVNRAKLDKRIEIVYNDALDVNLAGHKYDLIFIDAAKGQYIKFFEKFENYLNPGGVIISDNLKFHGLVKEKDRIESRNVKQLVGKIEKYIELNNVKTILEIGTAIGYSAMLMTSASPDVEVTTIERDDKKYREAVKNVNRAKLDKRIEIVYNDALDVNLAGHKYDLIFIDAAKGQYIKFFEKFENYLNPGGVIISDNLKFHGLVKEKDRIESRNVKQLVGKIEKYIEFLKGNDKYITKFYDIGDGLSVSFRKNEDKFKGIN